MATSFVQRFANAQRNSLVTERAEARGNIEKRVPYVGRHLKEDITDLFLLGDSLGLLATNKTLATFSLQDGKILAERSKQPQSPVVVGPNGLIHFCDGYLFAQSAATILDGETQWIIPGYPGTYSSLVFLLPRESVFISGVIAGPTPKDHQRRKLILGCRHYADGSAKLWTLEYERPVPPLPPLSHDGHLIVCRAEMVTRLSLEGEADPPEAALGVVQECSAGPTGGIYLICETDRVCTLLQLTDDLQRVSSCTTPFTRLSQPPVLSSGGGVFLIGSGMVAGYQGVVQQWVQLMEGTEGDPLIATAAANDRILVVAGNRLVCLAADGKQEWGYQKEDPEPFRTQPVVGRDGKIYVADNAALYVIS